MYLIQYMDLEPKTNSPYDCINLVQKEIWVTIPAQSISLLTEQSNEIPTRYISKVYGAVCDSKT